MNEISSPLFIKTCDTCAHTLRNVKDQIECHGGPPVVIPMVAANPFTGQPVQQLATTFPIVKPDWWCGAWRAKEPQLVIAGTSGLQQKTEANSV